MINMTNVEYIDYFEKIIANEPENILSLYFVQKLMSDVRFRSFQPMISAELQKKILKNKTLPQIAEESEYHAFPSDPDEHLLLQLFHKLSPMDKGRIIGQLEQKLAEK